VLITIEIDTRASQTQHFLVPRKRVKDFVGRGPQLRTITESFAAPRSSGPRVLIVHALGGQGKSQLALEYYRTSRAQNIYRGIFWVSAADRALATKSFNKIAIELGIIKAEQTTNNDASRQVGTELGFATTGQAFDDGTVIGLVKKTLEKWEERWLLIFDNYDSPTQFDDIQDFFTDGKSTLPSSIWQIIRSLTTSQRCPETF
jgi:hypothetical protein